MFTQKNEARRFIWLIDAVYESKSKLYCTSQRDVEELFNRQKMPEGADVGDGTWDDFMYKGMVTIIHCEFGIFCLLMHQKCFCEKMRRFVFSNNLW